MTQKQHYVLRVVAITVGFVISIPFMWSTAPIGEPEALAQSPSAVIVELDQRALAGDWAEAHRLFAYKNKGRTLLPDLWESASTEAKNAFVSLWKPQFRLGWERTRGAPDLKNSQWTLSEELLSPERALVEQRTIRRGRTLAIRYWLIKRQERWVIADRTYAVDGIEHSGTKIVQRIRLKITEQLGRKPTLEEFVANAPSWIGRVRVKTYRIP